MCDARWCGIPLAFCGNPICVQECGRLLEQGGRPWHRPLRSRSGIAGVEEFGLGRIVLVAYLGPRLATVKARARDTEPGSIGVPSIEFLVRVRGAARGAVSTLAAGLPRARAPCDVGGQEGGRCRGAGVIFAGMGPSAGEGRDGGLLFGGCDFGCQGRSVACSGSSSTELWLAGPVVVATADGHCAG